MNTLDAVFFDIGGTLGDFNPATGVFQPFPDSSKLLQEIGQGLGLRIGIISTIGPFTKDAVWSLLENGGLAVHIDRTGFVSEDDTYDRYLAVPQVYHPIDE